MTIAQTVTRPFLGLDVVARGYATRESWLGARRETIGASEAAMALGVSPYGTAFALWERKRAAAVEQTTDVLQRGHRWESAVLAEYEDESGCKVLEPAKAYAYAPGHIVVLSRRSCPWLTQSPDAFAIDRAGELGQVEAKTALRPGVWSPEPGIVVDEWDDAYADIVPAHYAIQGYVQLIVSGLPWVDLCALVPMRGWLGVRWVRLRRDTTTQDQIEGALTAWRQRHLIEGEPPELDSSAACNRYVGDRFPGLPGGKKRPTRDAAADEAAMLLEMAAISERAKADKERHDLLRNLLIASAQGERLTVGNAYGQTQNNSGRTTVDLDALRAAAPELVAKHERKGAPFATFNLYGFKSEG